MDIASLIGAGHEGLTQWFNALVGELSALDERLAETMALESALSAARLVVYVALVTAAGRVATRLSGRALAGLEHWVEASDGALASMRRLLGLLSRLGIETLAIALVVGIGYALLMVGFVTGELARVTAFQYLLALAALRFLSVATRATLAPDCPGLRMVPVADAPAASWQARINALWPPAVLGLVWVAPVVATVLPATAQMLEAMVLAGVLLQLGRLLASAHPPVSAFIKTRRARTPGMLSRGLLFVMGMAWHWVVGLAALLLAAVALLGSAAALLDTGVTIAATVAIGLVAGLLGHWVGIFARSPVHLPAAARTRLPMLEQRLRRWIPLIRRTTNGLVAAASIALVGHVWALWNLWVWLASPAGQSVVGALAGLLGVAVLSLAAWLVAASWIEDRLNPDTGSGAPGAREKTLLALFRNALAIVIVTLGAMVALSELGIDIGPLLAGAGVIGLAVGFGAQKLVQDIITGVFIQLEDAIHTDDFITAAGISGTVERLSIRSLGLRDLTGTLHVVPFSSVDTVSNYTRDFGYHLGEYGVAYRENIGEVVSHLHKAFERLKADDGVGDAVTGPLEVDGVTALADSAVNIRVRIRTVAGMQWAVGRAYNRVVKEVFDEAGIEIPYPHMTLYFGEDKTGNAPAARVALTQGGRPAAEDD
jgi:small conductance mechanosensitive channel